MNRRPTTVAHVGNIAIGGNNPIRIQSMTTTNTNDTASCVAQARRIIDAGGELVRLTTQGRREAENLKNISAALHAEGYTTPLLMWLPVMQRKCASIPATMLTLPASLNIWNIPMKNMQKNSRR